MFESHLSQLFRMDLTMIKIFKSHNWEVFDGTRDLAIKYILSYLEEMDFLDCDTCWEQYVELYDSEAEDITVFVAYYSGWSDGEKIYPVEIESDTKEKFKVRLNSSFVNVRWEHKLTQLDPKRDYII